MTFERELDPKLRTKSEGVRPNPLIPHGTAAILSVDTAFERPNATMPAVRISSTNVGAKAEAAATSPTNPAILSIIVATHSLSMRPRVAEQ